MITKVKNQQEIADMRVAGKMLATILKLMSRTAVPGITPYELARLAEKELKNLGGKPSFLGVGSSPPYPDIMCISVNNQIQHSIPSREPLASGDVVNFDFGVTYNKMITDAGITVGIGKIDDNARRLLEGTSRALDAGLSQVVDGCRVGDISSAVGAVLKKYKLGIVEDLVGHGVGHELHEDPNIPNHGGGRGFTFLEGMTICIEPIATLGDGGMIVDQDGWTLWTTDGSWSAQFEHTILVTKQGYEILTQL